MLLCAMVYTEVLQVLTGDNQTGPGSPEDHLRELNQAASTQK